MRKLKKTIHHFTKIELATEEIIIIVIICLLASVALSASAILPITARFVQCGHQKDLPEACQKDRRCCAFLEKLDHEMVKEWSVAPLPLEDDMDTKSPDPSQADHSHTFE